MENDGFDPMGSCFIFDYDPVAAGLNVVPYADRPDTKHTEFTEEDKQWLGAINRVM